MTSKLQLWFALKSRDFNIHSITIVRTLLVCLLIFFKVPVIISHAYNLTRKTEREIMRREMKKQVKLHSHNSLLFHYDCSIPENSSQKISKREVDSSYIVVYCVGTDDSYQYS